MRTLLCTLLLTSCTWTERDWREARTEAVCAVQTRCFATHPSIEACVAASPAAEDGTCPGFVPVEARACVRLVWEQSDACPDTVEAWQLPARCATVCTTPVSTP